MEKMIHARLDQESYDLITKLRRNTNWNDSEIVRNGIKALAESYISPKKKKIIGVGKFSSGVNDLGSNKKHLKDFGKK